MVNISWCFKRSYLPMVVKVTGGYMGADENLLVMEALRIIDFSEKYSGRLFADDSVDSTKFSVSVSFSLIFNTIENMQKFLDDFLGLTK